MAENKKNPFAWCPRTIWKFLRRSEKYQSAIHNFEKSISQKGYKTLRDFYYSMNNDSSLSRYIEPSRELGLQDNQIQYISNNWQLSLISGLNLSSTPVISYRKQFGRLSLFPINPKIEDPHSIIFDILWILRPAICIDPNMIEDYIPTPSDLTPLNYEESRLNIVIDLRFPIGQIVDHVREIAKLELNKNQNRNKIKNTSTFPLSFSDFGKVNFNLDELDKYMKCFDLKKATCLTNNDIGEEVWPDLEVSDHSHEDIKEVLAKKVDRTIRGVRNKISWLEKIAKPSEQEIRNYVKRQKK